MLFRQQPQGTALGVSQLFHWRALGPGLLQVMQQQLPLPGFMPVANLTKINAFHLALSWGLSRAPARSQQTQTLAIIRAIRYSLIKGPELKLTVILYKQLC